MITIVALHTQKIISSKASFQKDRFDLLVDKSIVIDLKQTMDIEPFFNIVSKAMSDQLNISPSVLSNMLIQREEEITTLVAPGLAIPHIIIEGEKKISLLLARCKKGMVFSKSKPLIHAAFVLVGS